MLSVSFLTKHGVRSRIVLVSFLSLQVLPPRTYVPTMAKFSPPADMDFSTPEAWPHWISRLSRFRVATKMNTESSAVQIATLLYSLGPSADGVFERELTFGDGADRDDFDKVLQGSRQSDIPWRCALLHVLAAPFQIRRRHASKCLRRSF